MYAQPPKELETLSARLLRVQTEYQRALSRGDAERIDRCRLQIRALAAERDGLLQRLAKAAPAPRPLLYTP